MNKHVPALLVLVSASSAQASDITITGVIDGPLSGGTPKAVELFVINDIPDLSVCGLGAANNGGGTDNQEFTFPSDAATAGSYLYVSLDTSQFNAFMGFAPDYTSNAMQINGDDAVELFCNNTVVDVFGDINTDGSGQSWEYLDGWAYRNSGTGPDGSTFVESNWTFSGPNALDGESSNASAATPFPVQTFAEGSGGDNGGGDNGGGDSGGSLAGVCFNCPDLSKVADASSFDDAAYYASAIAEVNAGSSASIIKSALTTIISQDHKNLTYSEVWTALTESDEDPANSDNVILMYSGLSLPKLSNGSGSQSSDPDNWNREHTWPNSHGFNSDAFEAYVDIHHLRPTDISVNGSRGNLDFDNSDNELTEAPANRIDGDSFEPRDAVKGDVARMMMYMDTRYEGLGGDATPDLVLVDELTSTGEAKLGRLCRLIEWHNADPVDAFETNRHNIIYEYQGNRNPFVDHPEWVELLYGSAACSDNGGGDNGGGDNGGGDTPSVGSSLIISGVVDGPLPGGVPKAIEFYATADIADLSVYGFGSANNGGGSDGEEYTFSGSASAGDYIYIALDEPNFNTYFGFNPTDTDNAAAINGDDAIELFKDGSVVDVFGDINTDGSGQAWEYTDGWAYRVDSTGPDGSTFNINNWTFSGTDALDGSADNASASTPFPVATYVAEETLIITGVFDGPLSGGVPKFVELYAATNIADLSIFGFGSANNGGGSDGEEFTLSGSASAGDFIYISLEEAGFNTFFGFTPDFTTDAAAINGDDAIELFKNGTVVDVFGDINTDGSGQAWEYLDGWASRVADTGPDGSTFVIESWTFSGRNAMDGETSNDSAETPFPIGQFAGGGNGGGDGGGDPDPDPTFGVCTDPATMIHGIQGNSGASPLVGSENIIIEAVVTADYQADGLLGGFYVQEEDADVDGDSATSEGIFVADTATEVNVGDLVRVQGSIAESFDLTVMNNVTQLAICSSGNSVTPASLTLPVASLDEFEQVEGMLVSISQPLTVNDVYNLGRFGQVTLSDSRQFQFTHNNLPDVDGYAAHLAALELNQIILDDAKTSQNPDPVVHPAGGLSASNTLRTGSVASIDGVMSYAFGDYRIHPTGEVLFSNNERPESPEDVGGNFKAAGINVLNYFTTIDNGAFICSPDADQECRGADSAEEFERQRDKLISAITSIDADILGLVEVENNANEAIADLVSGLNAATAEGTYAYVDTGIIGSDAIKVGLVYKPASATPTGAYAILDASVDPTFIDTKNRPVLAQTFTTETGEVFTVAVNHFKSKGTDCNELDDPDLNDGQGNCAATRAAAATALANWLATDPTSSGDSDFLILGDLNAYAKEDAITNLTDAGYTNLIEAFVGSEAYSYAFAAQVGYLDHALASGSLTDKVSGVTEWHINADEPRSLDYNTEFKSEAQVSAYYAADPFRASDHDPVVVGFDFVADVVEPDYDYNGNGVVDIRDFSALWRAITFGPAPGDEFDFNNDGKVDIFDAREILKNCTNVGCR